jgi:HlyD family secretion protein
LDRERSLVDQNYTSANRVDILEGALNEAVARQQEAAAALALLNEGTRSETIEQARADVAAHQANVDQLELTLARTAVVAPVSGMVDALPLELGERPQPGQTLAVLLAHGRTYARIHIPEPLRTRLNSGDRALVRVDGVPSDFAAKIRWISSDAAFTPYFALTQRDRSRLAYLAEVDLQEQTDLPMGIPVEVRFPDLDTSR